MVLLVVRAAWFARGEPFHPRARDEGRVVDLRW
jgi:hypothetical protein